VKKETKTEVNRGYVYNNTKQDSRRVSIGARTPVLTLGDLTIKSGELLFHNERKIQIIE
jgi:hypothetical protein